MSLITRIKRAVIVWGILAPIAGGMTLSVAISVTRSLVDSLIIAGTLSAIIFVLGLIAGIRGLDKERSTLKPQAVDPLSLKPWEDATPSSQESA